MYEYVRNYTRGGLCRRNVKKSDDRCCRIVASSVEESGNKTSHVYLRAQCRSQTGLLNAHEN